MKPLTPGLIISLSMLSPAFGQALATTLAAVTVGMDVGLGGIVIEFEPAAADSSARSSYALGQRSRSMSTRTFDPPTSPHASKPFSTSSGVPAGASTSMDTSMIVTNSASSDAANPSSSLAASRTTRTRPTQGQSANSDGCSMV